MMPPSICPHPLSLVHHRKLTCYYDMSFPWEVLRQLFMPHLSLDYLRLEPGIACFFPSFLPSYFI